MGLWDRLFGRSKEPARTEIQDEVRPELIEAVQEAIASILAQNFMMMGVEPQSVPLSGSTGSFRSRGYLVGLTEAVLGQFDAMNPTKAEFITALSTTFAMTYGRCDGSFALDTIDKFQANDPEVMDGFKLAYRDVESVYSGQPFAAPTGFWLLNSGDEDAIRFNLEGC